MEVQAGFLFALIAVFAMTSLDTPGIVSYQGKLTDVDGIGINGDYDLTFRLYRVAEEGEAIWEEIHPAVSVEKGLFSVILGQTEAIGLPFDEQYYLEIVIDGDVMEPRQRMTTEAYAFRARTADFALAVHWDSIDDVPTEIMYEGDNISLLSNDAGYITDETDPVFDAHVASGITSDDIYDWDEAHSWGDHSAEGYLTEETDPVFDAHVASGITSDDIYDWDEAYSWGDHRAEGYLTDVLTDGSIDGDGAGTPLFIAQQGATNGQVLKWNDADNTWRPADETAGGSSNWILDEDAGTLTTADRYGIFRYGSTGHGDHCSTHVNLGVEGTTGMDGHNRKYATVGGGMSNKAQGNYPDSALIS